MSTTAFEGFLRPTSSCKECVGIRETGGKTYVQRHFLQINSLPTVPRSVGFLLVTCCAPSPWFPYLTKVNVTIIYYDQELD